MNTMQVPESSVSQAERGADFDDEPLTIRRKLLDESSAFRFIVRNFELFPQVMLAVAVVALVHAAQKKNEQD